MRQLFDSLKFILLVFCVNANVVEKRNIQTPHAVLPPVPEVTPPHPNNPVTHPRPRPPSFLPPVEKSVDLNSDGKLSLSEIQYAAFVHHGLSGTVVERMFNETDKDHNGYLDSLEFDSLRVKILERAENAALRYLKNVDTDGDKLLSLTEAQKYMLKEYGIGSRDVERIWLLVVPDTKIKMDAAQFSKLRRRIRGMTIRLARQMMKTVDLNGDGHIAIDEAQAIAFEQEGIGAGDIAQMLMSVDDNNDGELNAPEFADFERIVRARAVETSQKALKVVDSDNSGTLTMDEAKKIAFEHYGFDEKILGPFFGQADENEDGQLDYVVFAGFRSVIRAKAVSLAIEVLKQIDYDNDGFINLEEAADKTKREDDMDPTETAMLFNIADQNKSGKLDKVELADFLRLVRLSAIKFATDHLKDFDADKNSVVSLEELATLIEAKYNVPLKITKIYFDKVDVDKNGDLGPGEIVDFRHEIRNYVAERNAQEKVTSSEEEIFSTSRSTQISSTSTIARVHPTTSAPTTSKVAPTKTHLNGAPIYRTNNIQNAAPQLADARLSLSNANSTMASTQRTQFPTLAPDTFFLGTSKYPKKVEVKPSLKESEVSTVVLHKSPLTSEEFDKLPFIKGPGKPLNTTIKVQPVPKAKDLNKQPKKGLPSSASAETTLTLEKIIPSKVMKAGNSPNSPDVVEYEYIEVEVDENGNELSRKLDHKKRKLVDAQKKELGIPAEEEVVYLDHDHSNSSTILPMEYETVIEYVDETESAKNANSTKSKFHPKVK
ncbi:hypothetical protein WR25_09097 [Diploscapter pachys]|uniref:EF-hand domain-containing protein n=1 Tax=Diploscapter pachys TaxID=2018661 RepID=A0A2A2LPK3_9BILA|nr:hypothetical protein WR25_09097 [Diploscapter pachys]